MTPVIFNLLDSSNSQYYSRIFVAPNLVAFPYSGSVVCGDALIIYTNASNGASVTQNLLPNIYEVSCHGGCGTYVTQFFIQVTETNGTPVSASSIIFGGPIPSANFSASYSLNSNSSSYALSASWAPGGSSVSASYALTASFATSASYSNTSSFATSASYAPPGALGLSASYALTSSYSNNTLSSSYSLSASWAPTLSSSYSNTSSYASFAATSNNSTSASYALNSSNASNATLANFASIALYSNQILNGNTTAPSTNPINITIPCLYYCDAGNSLYVWSTGSAAWIALITP